MKFSFCAIFVIVKKENKTPVLKLKKNSLSYTKKNKKLFCKNKAKKKNLIN